MKNLYIIIIFLFFSTNVLAQKKVTLQLSWLHQFQFAGYYIAKEKGFYKDIGVDVDINEVKFNIDVVSQVEKREVDFSIGRSSLIIDKMNGKDIVALGAIFQHSPLMLLVRKDSQINSVEDLRGKNIMLTKNAKKSASIQAMLNSNKLTENELNIIPHSFNLDDLISGKTDAMASYLSNEPIRLRDLKIDYNILHPKDYGFDFYNDILFTSSKLIKDDPLLVESFYNATIKGWEYAFENIIETAELIHEKYNTQNKTLIHLIKEGEILKSLAYHEDGSIGYLEKEKLKDILNVFKVLGLSNGVDDRLLDSFIYELNNYKQMSFNYTPEQRNIFVITLIFLFLLFLLSLYFMRKLHFEKSLLNSVINSSDDLIYYKDKNFKYLGCNEAFEKFVGKSKSQIIGKGISEVFDESTSELFGSLDRKVIDENKVGISTKWVESASGDEFYLQNKKTPFKYSMNQVGVVGVCRDLTTVKQLEKEHLEQQKNLLTQSKIVAMGEMIGNIAHQWRQPLSIITTSVSSLNLISELENKNLKEEDVKYYSNIVLEQAQNLSKTIDDFQSFFTQDSEDIKKFNIKETLLKVKILISNSFESENIKIVSKVNDFNIVSNEKSLIQAFVNICNNAKDAIIINNIAKEKRYFFIELSKVEGNMKITFKDSAGGIDPSIIDKILEPYFTTKHQSQGTGIGLYMTNQIITKQLNGTIGFENIEYSHEDKDLKGTIVSITIPTN